MGSVAAVVAKTAGLCGGAVVAAAAVAGAFTAVVGDGGGGYSCKGGTVVIHSINRILPMTRDMSHMFFYM